MSKSNGRGGAEAKGQFPGKGRANDYNLDSSALKFMNLHPAEQMGQFEEDLSLQINGRQLFQNERNASTFSELRLI